MPELKVGQRWRNPERGAFIIVRVNGNDFDYRWIGSNRTIYAAGVNINQLLRLGYALEESYIVESVLKLYDAA